MAYCQIQSQRVFALWHSHQPAVTAADTTRRVPRLHYQQGVVEPQQQRQILSILNAFCVVVQIYSSNQMVAGHFPTCLRAVEQTINGHLDEPAEARLPSAATD